MVCFKKLVVAQYVRSDMRVVICFNSELLDGALLGDSGAALSNALYGDRVIRIMDVDHKIRITDQVNARLCVQ